MNLDADSLKTDGDIDGDDCNGGGDSDVTVGGDNCGGGGSVSRSEVAGRIHGYISGSVTYCESNGGRSVSVDDGRSKLG